MSKAESRQQQRQRQEQTAGRPSVGVPAAQTGAGAVWCAAGARSRLGHVRDLRGCAWHGQIVYCSWRAVRGAQRCAAVLLWSLTRYQVPRTLRPARRESRRSTHCTPTGRSGRLRPWLSPPLSTPGTAFRSLCSARSLPRRVGWQRVASQRLATNRITAARIAGARAAVVAFVIACSPVLPLVARPL